MKVKKEETLYHEDHGATLKHKCGKRIVTLSLLYFSLSFLYGPFPLFMASFFVRSLIPTCGGIIVFVILSSLGQCSNNENWWSSHFYLLTTQYYNSIPITKYDSIWMPLAVYQDVQWSSVTCMKNDERWLSHKYSISYMIMQSNMKMNAQVTKNGSGGSCMAIYLGMAMERP